MEIVLVFWKVDDPKKEVEFLDFWSKSLKISDKSVLIAEHISRVKPPKGEYFKLDLARDHGTGEMDYKGATFVNVGLWKSKIDFDCETERARQDPEIKKQLDELGTKVVGRVWLSPERVRDGLCKSTLGNVTFVD